jgi:anthranilate phosphoribosyltransferase
MDRFELEDKITAMNNTVEELNMLFKMVLEQDIDHDAIASTLFGIRMLYEGRQAELFDTFTQVFKLDQYAEIDKEKFNNVWTKYSHSEDTNPSIDVDFNGIKACCKRNCKS